MRAHKIKVVVTEDHEIRAKLPSDFPAGSAELIVISDSEQAVDSSNEQKAQDFGAWLEALLKKVPRGVALPDVIDRST